MKYIIIIATLLTFSQPVFAAKMVTGSVPVVQPLQPAPVGVKPNLSHNVQYSDPSHVDNSGQSGAPSSNPTKSQITQLPGNQLINPGLKPGGHNYLVWSLVLIICGLIGWLIFKHRKSNNND